jgi:hypothetical protein
VANTRRDKVPALVNLRNVPCFMVTPSQSLDAA